MIGPAFLAYVHVDVFSPTPFGGNSLPVFLDASGLDAGEMLAITRELRHFEAIFLEPTAQAEVVRARIFDLIEELPFAGHPVLGAAAVLHHRAGGAALCEWRFELAAKTLGVVTERTEAGYRGLLDQGAPDFLGVIDDGEAVARAFDLETDDLDPGLPLEVASTGLRYLVVPVLPGALDRARIRRDITGLLHGHGAQFAVLLDEAAVEVRHWNNDGIVEDVATGSAAGVIGAYRLKHGLATAGEDFVISQGRFTGRPSRLVVRAEGRPDAVQTVKVGGDVAIVGHGALLARPAIAA